MHDVPDIYDLNDKLTTARGQFNPDEQRIGLTLIRELAYGAPVSLSRLATEVDLPDAQVGAALEHLPGVFRDINSASLGSWA